MQINITGSRKHPLTDGPLLSPLHLKVRCTFSLTTQSLIFYHLIPICIQDGDRGAQAMANGGVLRVRRSETGRRQRRYTLEVESVSDQVSDFKYHQRLASGRRHVVDPVGHLGLVGDDVALRQPDLIRTHFTLYLA